MLEITFKASLWDNIRINDLCNNMEKIITLLIWSVGPVCVVCLFIIMDVRLSVYWLY